MILAIDELSACLGTEGGNEIRSYLDIIYLQTN